jgi:hypothetical protein
LFGVPISPAAVCDLQRKTAAALGPVVREAHAYVAGRPANVDETGWREGRQRGWLWVSVTAAVTVFLVRLSRARPVLADLIAGDPGVLTTDRYAAYDHLPADKRQVCWAHLRCHFQAMIRPTERRGGRPRRAADARRNPTGPVAADAGRDEQFEYIASQRKRFSASGLPGISVDTKQKVSIGEFFRPGRAWCRTAAEVHGYDFTSLAEYRPVPYGILCHGEE